MKSSKITHFFDVIKKEVVSEDEEITPVFCEHTNVKQEYHYKEELDLVWDEEENDSENPSHDDVDNDFSIHDNDNAVGTFNAKTSKRQRFVQYYRKIFPKCNKIASSEKQSQKCENCESQRIYECKKCKKQYPTYSRVISHFTSKCLEEGYYFACFECDYKSVSKSRVNKHLKDIHSVYQSLNRIKKFKSDNVLKDISGAEAQKCSKCGDEFQKLQTLLRHMQICGQTKSNANSNNMSATLSVVKGRCKHHCVTCNKTVKNDSVGFFHQKKCKTCNSKLSFKCKECNKIFPSYWSINKHLKINHSVGKDVVKCFECDYETSDIQLLRRHVVRKHVVQTNRCQICGKIFNNREVFNTHLRNSHIQQPEFQCDNCSYRSKFKQNLSRHIMDMHSGENDVECPKCNLALKSERSLKFHLTYCQKEPRHQCNKCSFKSKYKICLTRHYENIHSSSPPKKERKK